jgi:hypothetical protein
MGNQASFAVVMVYMATEENSNSYSAVAAYWNGNYLTMRHIPKDDIKKMHESPDTLHLLLKGNFSQGDIAFGGPIGWDNVVTRVEAIRIPTTTGKSQVFELTDQKERHVAIDVNTGKKLQVNPADINIQPNSISYTWVLPENDDDFDNTPLIPFRKRSVFSQCFDREM